MTLALNIKSIVCEKLQQLFPDNTFTIDQVAINLTKPEFEGDYTVVLFPFVKLLKQKPDVLGNMLGEALLQDNNLVSKYQIVSGFLNLTIKDSVWFSFLSNNVTNSSFGKTTTISNKVMVEYSSPNTNKPLHFGHLRNIFLGAAVSNILSEAGNSVVKANLINDRGIHICKSMIAWQMLGNGVTPESTGIKGDHLVGDYYVKFNDVYKAEIEELVAKGTDKKIAEKEAPIMLAAQEMLRKWEMGNTEVKQLWATMNGWVYDGFDVTYNKLGVSFDVKYYESDTYLLGKKLVETGLEKGVLFKKEDGSVWIDLTADGLDQKLLLRGDGTSVYMTQDLGTAVMKYNDHQLNKSVYVIADEQNYHMQVLQLILKKMGEPCADGIYHLSYGMVELPSGRMKSREGTVVDADDMIAEMYNLSKEQTEKAGKTEGFSAEELDRLYNMIGLGALKFYLLRVEPKKKMIFNPQESIDLHGFTATFIQYAHARICSILRKEGKATIPSDLTFPGLSIESALSTAEKKLICQLEQYPTILKAAADEYNPSELCNYSFQLAQSFNSFYDAHSVSNAESEEKKQLRIMIIVLTARVLRNAMGLLGIELPERM